MQQESFEAMKQEISSAPILKIVDPKKTFEIEIDALQWVESLTKKVGLYLLRARSFLLANKIGQHMNKSFMLLFIHWKSRSINYMVQTDHHTLKYFCNQPDIWGHQAWWAKMIEEFHMKIL